MIFLYVFIIGHVTCDIRRYDTGYDADFRVINKGRLYNSLMWFENNDLGECMLNCIRLLNCITFNYNPDTKQCELADEEFDEYEADTVEPGWFNYGTPQKIDGGFSDWVNGSCNAACGGGVRYQRRSCTNPEPKFGGGPCSGETSRTMECNTHPCPIDGGLSDWINGSCSTQCGGGQLTQTKTCTIPAPQHGGADCVGDRTRTLACNEHPCPINGGFTSWTSVGQCSAVCGHGQIAQTRTCTQPIPQLGGHDCVGTKSQTATCILKHCPVNGEWTSWTPTSQCSKSCDGGQKREMRHCTNPTPKHGGAGCTGGDTRTVSCNTGCCKATTKGTCCKFPFKYKYIPIPFHDCVPRFNTCRDTKGNMEECA